MKIALVIGAVILACLAVLWLVLRTRDRRVQAEAETKLSLSEMMVAMRPERAPRRRHGSRSSRADR